MDLDIELELKRLTQATVSELLAIYREVSGHPASSRHKQHLIRRIAWRLQAREQNPALLDRALRRVAELIDPQDLRVSTATRVSDNTNSSRPAPSSGALISGTVISRLYKDELLEVRVLDAGFEFCGQVFRSLSAVANHVTGSHWNGH